MAFRKFGAATATALMLAFAASPAYAVTEIQWWHAMTGPNNDVGVKLANDFNASQSGYKIGPTFKGRHPHERAPQGRGQARVRTDEGAGRTVRCQILSAGDHRLLFDIEGRHVVVP